MFTAQTHWQIIENRIY